MQNVVSWQFIENSIQTQNSNTLAYFLNKVTSNLFFIEERFRATPSKSQNLHKNVAFMSFSHCCDLLMAKPKNIFWF